MKRSDKLRQARVALVEKLKTMETDAADRIFTDDEQKAFDGLIKEINGIDTQITSAVTAEEAIAAIIRPPQSSQPATTAKEQVAPTPTRSGCSLPGSTTPISALGGSFAP